MKAPPGAEVGLYLDLVATVNVGDVVETRSGRRYLVVAVRRQERGKHAGRWHVRAVVLGEDELPAAFLRLTAIDVIAGVGPRVHRIRWYARHRRSSGGVARRR